MLPKAAKRSTQAPKELDHRSTVLSDLIGPDHRFMHDGTYKKTLDFEGFSGAWCFIVILHFPHHLLPPAGPA